MQTTRPRRRYVPERRDLEHTAVQFESFAVATEGHPTDRKSVV